jgi:hypothetical protein
MMWQEVDVAAFQHGERVDARVRFAVETDCLVEVHIAPETTITKKDSDFWEALLQVRTELERDDIQLGCNGARIDVFPSQMQRQAIRGRKAYVLVKPRTAKRCEVVDIFGPASLELVGTVAEQRAFYDGWLRGDG